MNGAELAVLRGFWQKNGRGPLGVKKNLNRTTYFYSHIDEYVLRKVHTNHPIEVPIFTNPKFKCIDQSNSNLCLLAIVPPPPL
jgi:hypothetical protein